MKESIYDCRSISNIFMVFFLMALIACTADKTTKTPDQNFSKIHNFALPQESNNIDFNVDTIKRDLAAVTIEGWGAIKNLDSKNSTIYLVLKADDKSSIYSTVSYKRPDVTFASKMDRDDSGFRSIIPIDRLEKRKYTIGLFIKKDNQTALHYSDNTLSL